ncbi:MAG: exo-alpha-sialidase [Armatimonadetes bacterium]|nr:exo-alpha-sialidase [Armatimonadota bacterium]
MPIVTVNREVCIPWTEGHGAPNLSVRYLGKGLRREESRGYEEASDWGSEHYRVRTSEDNGRTWSDWIPVRGNWPSREGLVKSEYPSACCHDPASGRIVQSVFQRFLIGEEGAEAIQRRWRTGQQTYFDHGYWQTSSDEGRTWTDPRQRRYEEGPCLAPGETPSEEYLRTNQMYAGYTAIATREGTILFPVAESPVAITDRGQSETVHGVRCFIGKWNPEAEDYCWEVSQPITVPHRISGRGLQEPDIAELKDGRLLLEMRGSSVAVEQEWKGKTESPGRRWISLSSEGGRTWSMVTDLRYDTGEQFYSPSSLARLLRHSRTGKLYWFGNITPTPPDGGLPRYPLYMAELDETIPAIRKHTLTVIDDYDRGHDSAKIQLSNFGVLEDRETGVIELYMTRYGERESHWLHADAYKYTITLGND